MNTYYKIKIFMEYILPVVFFAVIIAIILICCIVSGIKESRIHKFFLSHGYKRELFDVSSVGKGSYYVWVRESDRKRVDDRDIKGCSLKKIKEKYQ